jgi:hypothetical protein
MQTYPNRARRHTRINLLKQRTYRLRRQLARQEAKELGRGFNLGLSIDQYAAIKRKVKKI